MTFGYINNSLHLARKYARIFVRGHYLFREANSFPRAKLEENCELRGTDNVQGQISEHIFKAKLRLLCLLSFKYFSQQAGSASPSYVNTSKFVNWLPKPRHSIFISRISSRLNRLNKGMLNNCEAKGLGCVLTLPIYRGREQHGNGREAGDKGTGSGRVRYGRR